MTRRSIKWASLFLMATLVLVNYPASAAHMKGKPKLTILLNWMKKTKKARDPAVQKFVIKTQPEKKAIVDLSVFSAMPKIGSHEGVADLVKNTSVISVLYFDGKKITINEHAKRVSKNTLLPSISMSKSITGYLLGHAICEKKIDALSDTADRYLDVTKGTFYAKRTLRQLVNMTNGDGNVNVRDFASNVRTLRKMYNSSWKGGMPPLFNGKDYDFTPSYDMLAANYGTTLSHYLKGTQNLKETSLTFNYGGIPPDIIINIIGRAVGSIESFTAKYIAGRSGASYPLIWLKQRDGALGAQMGLYMTREDWLKVAMMINQDWQSDQCIGRYLRDIEAGATRANGAEYGGFFWFKKNASMRGHLGQTIVLDRSSGAVLAVHSMASDHDYQSDFGSILPR